MPNKTKSTRTEPVRFALRLPPDVHEWLKEQAEQTDRSLNSYIVYMAKQMQQCSEKPAEHRAP